MTNQSTIDKLLEMRLTSMSDAFITQMNDPKMKDVSFEDLFRGFTINGSYVFYIVLNCLICFIYIQF